MTLNTIGLYLYILFFIVSFSQLHTIIPGLTFLKLGFISSAIIFLLVLPNIKYIRWYFPLGKYRFLFIMSIIPGIFFGYSTGKSASTFIYSLQELIVGFIAVCIFVNTERKIVTINKVLLFTTFIISLFVLTHGGHGPGILNDENDVGLVLTMLLPFAYFTITTSEKKISKALLICLLVFAILAVARTLSRGAMVGIIPTMLMIWLNSRNKFLTLILIILAVVFAIEFGPSNLITEFASIQDTTGGTAGSRRYFWELSIELFKKKPLFGVGAQGWSNAVWSGLIYLPQNVSNSTPHSLYFQLISELGLFGIITWTALIIATFKLSHKTNKILNYVKKDTKDVNVIKEIDILSTFNKSLLIGLFGGLICGIFLSFLFYSHIYLFIGLLQTTYIIACNKYNSIITNIKNQ